MTRPNQPNRIILPTVRYRLAATFLEGFADLLLLLTGSVLCAFGLLWGAIYAAGGPDSVLAGGIGFFLIGALLIWLYNPNRRW